MNDMENATKFYKQVLHQDNMNIEAIACIATHYFYTDQPEIALKFYRSKAKSLDVVVTGKALNRVHKAFNCRSRIRLARP